MNNRAAELLNDSYERCMMRPGFLDRFYDLFVSSSEEVAEKFANTDFKKQKLLLKTTLYLMMTSSGLKTPEITVYMERIAEKHSKKHLDIRPELYDLWLDCLLQTVSEFDTAYNPDVDASWREILSSSIKLMKSRYI